MNAALAVSLLVLAAAPKSPPKDLLFLWLQADDQVAQGDAAAALESMRQALQVIRGAPKEATLTGPKGAAWKKGEAVFHAAVRAGEIASLVAWRDAVPFFELAVKTAPDKAAKKDAKARLQAAKDNVDAGVEKAPSFLGDDLDEVTEGQWRPQQEAPAE